MYLFIRRALEQIYEGHGMQNCNFACCVGAKLGLSH